MGYAMNEIRDLGKMIGEQATLHGWLAKKRSSGKIAFLQLRDGSGVVQAVASRSDLPKAAWEEAERATQESTIWLEGTVQEDKRAPSGVELHVTDLKVDHLTDEFPITPKEHGTAFLMQHRHLWLRSSRQRAALQVRSEVCTGDQRFLLRAGLCPDRLADPDSCGLRRDLDPLRDRLLRGPSIL